MQAFSCLRGQRLASVKSESACHSERLLLGRLHCQCLLFSRDWIQWTGSHCEPSRSIKYSLYWFSYSCIIKHSTVVWCNVNLACWRLFKIRGDNFLIATSGLRKNDPDCLAIQLETCKLQPIWLILGRVSVLLITNYLSEPSQLYLRCSTLVSNLACTLQLLPLRLEV